MARRGFGSRTNEKRAPGLASGVLTGCGGRVRIYDLQVMNRVWRAQRPEAKIDTVWTSAGRQRPHVTHLNPRKCPQSAGYSSMVVDAVQIEPVCVEKFPSRAENRQIYRFDPVFRIAERTVSCVAQPHGMCRSPARSVVEPRVAGIPRYRSWKDLAEARRP